MADHFGVTDEELQIEEIPEKLVHEYNEQKGEIFYELKGSAEYNDAKLYLFLNVKSIPSVSSWVSYFQQANIKLPGIKNQFQHLMCMVVLGDELYAFSVGQSAVLIERFLDMSFPINVARRIGKPEIKDATANHITGVSLASNVHFRNPRRITYTEALDTVWTALSGYLRDEFLSSSDVEGIFGKKKKIKLDVGSSLRFGPKVEELSKFIDLIKWLGQREEGELPSDDGLAFLDTIKLLNPRKRKHLIDQLKTSLAKQIFENGDTENLALSHSNVYIYAAATDYRVKQNNAIVLETTYQPMIKDVLDSVTIDADTEIDKNLTAISIDSLNSEYGPNYSTEGSLLAHLNGEITYKGKTYFLLSGKWYEVDASYIELVDKDFNDLLPELQMERAVIGLKDWIPSMKNEGEYNQNSLQYDEKIDGDKVLTNNVELFDTLAYKDDDTVYIIHVKNGFNVKIRDVKSQITASAEIIENDIRSSMIRLKSHHENLVSKGKTEMSWDQFKKLFTERKRVYVLAYAKADKVSGSDDTNSSIAKMELVSLASTFGQLSSGQADLKLVWIPRPRS